MEPALREGYETARRMLRRHDPTYYLATRRLPSPTERRAALDAWEAQLQTPRHPVALALTDAAHRHGLPLEELSTYMRSMRVDCEPPIRIDTYEQLASYMDGSAGTVGRIMAALLGVPPDHHADIGRLGV